MYRYMPYVVSLLMMKLTVLMLIASQHNIRPYKLTTNSSSITTNEDNPDDNVWQTWNNLDKANIEASAVNRTHASSIWLIYNRVPRSGGLTIVFLIKELAKRNHFSHQRHQ